MRKVIGTGETTLDIIFRSEQPSAAVPGDSVFSGIISLSRTGAPVCFISETGNDHIGDTILRLMHNNHIPTEHINVLPGGKSPVSLTFLNDNNDAEYIFYKDYSKQRSGIIYPGLKEDGIVVIGSYYVLNPVLCKRMLELLDRAREKKAIIYYNPGFRSPHREEAIKLAPIIIKNLEYADIACGSQGDFFHIYNLRDTDKIYKDKIKFYCPSFLCTAGTGKTTLRTGSVSKEYDIPPLEAVNTVRIGDNFNIGIIYGLLKHDVRYDDLNGISEAKWDEVIRCGVEFAAGVYKSYSNSVSGESAEGYRY